MRLLYIFAIFILFTPYVQAYTPSNFDEFTDASMYIQPKYPEPGEEVLVNLQSYTNNLHNIFIQWLYGGKIIKEGVGVTNVKIIAPKLGKSLKLKAKIKGVTDLERDIAPILIDILWTAQTYTPKRYLGRALPTNRSKIQAVAIPHLGKSNIDPNKLTYNWYKNNRFLTKNSGINMSKITTASPNIYDEYILNVEVLDRKGNKLGRSGVNIKTVKPEVLLYTIHPLLGVRYNTSLNNPTLNNNISDEARIVAEPYYFSTINTNLLSYVWKANNMNLEKTSSPQSVTILKSTPGASLSVYVKDKNKLLQYSDTTYTMSRKNNSLNTSPNTQNNKTYTSPFGSPPGI